VGWAAAAGALGLSYFFWRSLERKDSRRSVDEKNIPFCIIYAVVGAGDLRHRHVRE